VFISKSPKQHLEWKDNVIIKNKYTKLDKVKLVALVDKTLNKTLFKENIKFGFRVTSI
jgi:hypothetical protein